MEAGTLIEWERQPGDAVKRGDVIAVVETQKGAIEIEVYEDGVLESILAKLGDKVPVGTPLAIIGDGGTVSEGSNTKNTTPATEVIKDTDTRPHEILSNENPASNVGAEVETKAKVIAAMPPRSIGTEHLRATPAAKQLALESNIDLTRLTGSGPASAIVLDDVRAAIGSDKDTQAMIDAASAPAKVQEAVSGVSPMNGMRAAIAAAMSRSKREIPHYYLSHTVQLDNLLTYVHEKNAQRAPEDRLLSGAAYIKTVALAAKKYPEFNGFFEGGRFTPGKAVHIGMVINIRGGGLVAPAIHNADSLSVDDTMMKLKDVVARVRKGRFKAAELSDPTITISSLGDRGVESLYGVIFPPQVAIIGFGTPVSTVQIIDGNVVPIHTITITLAADHRVSDGHRGALFLRTIGRYLNNPEKLK